jgi:hypothetical protein
MILPEKFPEALLIGFRSLQLSILIKGKLPHTLHTGPAFRAVNPRRPITAGLRFKFMYGT